VKQFKSGSLAAISALHSARTAAARRVPLAICVHDVAGRSHHGRTTAPVLKQRQRPIEEPSADAFEARKLRAIPAFGIFKVYPATPMPRARTARAVVMGLGHGSMIAYSPPSCLESRSSQVRCDR